MIVTQAAEAPPSYRSRQQRLRKVLASPMPSASAAASSGSIADAGAGWQLAAPSPVGSSLLILRAWVLLLRLLVQVRLCGFGGGARGLWRRPCGGWAHELGP